MVRRHSQADMPSGFPPNPKTISVGPWGGDPWGGEDGDSPDGDSWASGVSDNGVSWDDGVYDGIRQIIVLYGDAISSINIEYERNGAFVWSRHEGIEIGGKEGIGGNRLEKIELDYPNEKITSISGHYDNYLYYGNVLRSLTFESKVSNVKKIYGPYGVEDGTYFSFSMAEGEIVGFHGRSNCYLKRIGVYISNLQAPEISKSLTPISVGPWGGKGGDMWDDGVYSGIHQIKVVYGDAIDSINIEYDKNGSLFCSERGGSGGNKIGKIQLDYPKEILTSISGHYDSYLRSLTFKSNLKKYGPYGRQQGTYFSFPISDGRIVGFHGRSGLYLDCIGVYISNLHTAVPPKSNTVIAPWGGKGGVQWDDGACAGVRQIILVHGRAIDSIQIEYERDGSSVWSRHGGRGGNKKDMIILDYPRERLISISGHYDDDLRLLSFESNLKKYGPYGVQQGTYFSFPTTDGVYLSNLDSIGAYISNLQYSIPSQSNTVISIGPWGGKGGVQWDDGACAGVRRIILVHGRAIDSIQIEYDRDGSSVWSRHGGRAGNKRGGNKNDTETKDIILDYPTESLISISGHYGNYLRSLSFKSNLNEYGPYGVEQGTYFSFPTTEGREGRIVGFHGKSRVYLDSIGVYISNLHY